MTGEFTIDRTGWESGSWDAEPDRQEWRYLSFPCLIVRSEMSGALCGYVGVSPGHPWFGRGYCAPPIDNVLIHGGVTFAAPCHPKSPICHVPQSGESDHVWWIGFDCCHAWDLAPGLHSRMKRLLPGSLDDIPFLEYRDFDYVIGEVADLARQALAAVNGSRLLMTSLSP